jgi:hypothetical protein
MPQSVTENKKIVLRSSNVKFFYIFLKIFLRPKKLYWGSGGCGELRYDFDVAFDFNILTALKGWVGHATQGRGALHKN